MGRNFSTGKSSLIIRDGNISNFLAFLQNEVKTNDSTLEMLQSALEEHYWVHHHSEDNIHTFILDDSDSDDEVDFERFVEWANYIEDGSYMEEWPGSEANEYYDLNKGESVCSRWEKINGEMKAGIYGVSNGSYRKIEDIEAWD